MRKRQLFASSLLASALLEAASATAALPPAYQRVQEIIAVVKIAASLLESAIKDVQHVDDDRYDVDDGRCHVEVRIVPQRSKGKSPGPLLFSAVPGRVECR